MAKGKSTPTVAVCVNEYKRPETYKRNYSFDKKDTLTPREQLLGKSKWDKRFEQDYGESSHMGSDKERAFMKGTPHKFKHARPARRKSK